MQYKIRSKKTASHLETQKNKKWKSKQSKTYPDRAERPCPFTCIGAILGIIFMLFFRKIDSSGSHLLFSIFHPSHVVLSAMVTTSMFRVHELRKNFLLVIFIGYFGSVGIATLSDIIIPHLGTKVIGLEMPTHEQVHEHAIEDKNHHPAELDNAGPQTTENGIHLGFIEEWYIVTPAAFLGILLAFFSPEPSFPTQAIY